nr:cobalamin biosynthesis protein CbiA [Deltaproteobacteria bacterium]
DLDIVNPYFRSREAIKIMEKEGINVVVPRGGNFHADLPIILPEIRGLFKKKAGPAIFDVGGDEVGSRILSSFEDVIQSDYELLQVVNFNRPFTSTTEGVLTMKDQLEFASHLKVTGFIGNTHLLEQTDMQIVLKGFEFLQETSAQAGVPIRFITAHHSMAEEVAQKIGDIPVLPVKRILQPPWKPGGIKKIGNKRHLQV